MAISVRILRVWRKSALKEIKYLNDHGRTNDSRHLYDVVKIRDTNNSILQMTQELLDQHLIKGGN